MTSLYVVSPMIPGHREKHVKQNLMLREQACATQCVSIEAQILVQSSVKTAWI